MEAGQTQLLEGAPDPAEFPGNFIHQRKENGDMGLCRVHYLDHAGATLFSAEQLQSAMSALSQLNMNPHT